MGKKAKKAGKAGLPKKVAGVKVPKELRRAGAELLALAREPLLREIALAAATAALAARKDVRTAAKQAAKGAGDAAGEGVANTGWAAAALAAAAAEAGRRLAAAYGDPSRKKR